MFVSSVVSKPKLSKFVKACTTCRNDTARDVQKEVLFVVTNSSDKSNDPVIDYN